MGAFGGSGHRLAKSLGTPTAMDIADRIVPSALFCIWSTGFSSGRGCDCLASPLSREVARTKFAHDEGIHPHTQQRCRAKHSGFIPVKKTYGEQERFPQLIRSRPLGLDLLRQTVDLGHRNLPSISGKVSAVEGCAIDPVKWGRNRRPSGLKPDSDLTNALVLRTAVDRVVGIDRLFASDHRTTDLADTALAGACASRSLPGWRRKT